MSENNAQLTPSQDETTRSAGASNQEAVAVEATPREAATPRDARYLTPRASLTETTDAITLDLEVPGVARDAIQITLEHDELEIVAPRKPDALASAQPLRRERPRLAYRRSFVLGDRIDGSRVSAAYADGVLTLTLPKLEAAKPRRIQVA